MAKIVDNDKGFKVISLSTEEAEKLNWGIWTRNEDDTEDECYFLCMNCNHCIEDELYYIAVLNDTMCKDCYKEWLKNAKRYSEDIPIEDRNFNYYKEKLSL